MPVKKLTDHESSDFTYTLNSGTSVTLPRFKSVVTFGTARRLRHLSEAEQFFTIVEQVCDEETLAALDPMDADETEAFFTAWQEHSGATLGE